MQLLQIYFAQNLPIMLISFADLFFESLVQNWQLNFFGVNMWT